MAIPVCAGENINPYIFGHAQMEASQMFRRAGVLLEWREEKLNWCRKSDRPTIHIAYSFQTAADLEPGSLAYAMPYEGVHINVFYDRIPGSDNNSRAKALAHVLVHEITHILQGVSRHSDSGIMKARWDKADYTRMRWVPLAFTDFDVLLIQQGIQSWVTGERFQNMGARSLTIVPLATGVISSNKGL